MTINEIKNDNRVILELTGRLDSSNANELDKTIAEIPDNTKDLVFDLNGLDYISSAGLRSMLTAQKKMSAANGKLTVTNLNEIVREIFEVTGFSDFLNIE